MTSVKPRDDQPSEVTGARSASALSKPAPLLITIACGLICYGLFYNRGLGLSVIGYSIAPAERVLQGEVPYRDFLFNYTPGILWVNAALMKAFGVTLMATRIGLLAFKMITLIILFSVARRITGRWTALVPVGLTLAWLGHQQIFNVYPDQYLVLFALASLSCMLSYDSTGRGRWLLICGVAIGVVFVFKYNVGVLLCGSGALAIVARELSMSRRLSKAVNDLGLYLLGFSVVAAALAGYLIYNNALRAMISHFLHHAAEYSETRSVMLPPAGVVLPAALASLAAIGLGMLLLRAAGRFFGVYIAMVLAIGTVILVARVRAASLGESAIASVAYFPPLVFAVALGVAIWQLKNEERKANWWRENGGIAITGLFALAVYLEVFPRADFHHLVRVLPPVFLFFFGLLVRCLPSLTDGLRGRVPSPNRVAVLTVSTPLIFLLLAGVQDTWVPEFDSGLRFRDSRTLKIDRGLGIFVEQKQAELTEGLVQLIQDNSAEDDYIFSFAQRGSALYFLAARRNPTRFLWWRSVGISAEEREGVMAMIADRRAKLIVIQDVAATQEIQDSIDDHYDRIGVVADIAVYGPKQRTEGRRQGSGLVISDAANGKLTGN